MSKCTYSAVKSVPLKLIHSTHTDKKTRFVMKRPLLLFLFTVYNQYISIKHMLFHFLCNQFKCFNEIKQVRNNYKCVMLN